MEVVYVSNKTATGSNRNGSYSVSCYLLDYVLSKSEYTFTFTYTQVDVKKNESMLKSIRFPQSVKVLKMRRCGEEMIEENPDVDGVTDKINGYSDRENGNRRCLGISRCESLKEVLQRTRTDSGEDSTSDEPPIPSLHNELPPPDSVVSGPFKRVRGHSRRSSELQGKIVPTDQTKQYQGSWFSVNSSTITKLFEESPKNKRLYTFNIVIKCEGSVRTPYFDISRTPLYIKSRCYLLNEKDSAGTECAEVFIKEIGNLIIYNINIDRYVISSNCSKLVLEPMLEKTLSKYQACAFVMATIRDLDDNETTRKVVATIKPTCLEIDSNSDIAFVEGSNISMSCMFYYPTKK